MRERIEQDLATALARLQADGVVPADINPKIAVTRTRDASHGNFTSNLAMMLAKPADRSPRDVAQALLDALPASEAIRDVVIARPGFINFFQAEAAQSAVVKDVLSRADEFGRSDVGAGRKIQVEFLSARPTGPLQVGHGRSAALGATIANLLDAVGFEVQREYHVRDAGRQMDILASSVWLRYLTLAGEQFDFPSNGYRGDYVLNISQALLDEFSMRFRHASERVFDGVEADESAGGDKDRHIDGLIRQARTLLGEEDYRLIFDKALNTILDDIRNDLEEFGIHHDRWFSERSLSEDVSRVIEKLEAAGHLYEKEGVRWFRATDFGDDKDRAVIRANGQSTCLASDIACIDNTFERGFDQVLQVSGAKHHGYTARLQAACEALGHSREKLEFLPTRFAVLYRGGQQMPMSTRSDSFATMRELRDEVGNDAARYFYVMRKYTQHLDFDLDLARSQSNDNPVYHVQYAHARVCSVMRQLKQRELAFDLDAGLAALSRLDQSAETDLMTLLATYPELLQRAALSREPHQVTGYLRDLANGLHSYYNAHKVLVEDDQLRHARICLLLAVRQVLSNGLTLIGVSTPEVM